MPSQKAPVQVNSLTKVNAVEDQVELHVLFKRQYDCKCSFNTLLNICVIFSAYDSEI